MSNDFLASITGAHSLLSESKIISHLSKPGKAVIITTEDLSFLYRDISYLMDAIEKAALSSIHHFTLGNIPGCIEHEKVGSSSMTESEFYNLIHSGYMKKNRYCFVINSGIQYVIKDGKIDEDCVASFSKTKTMQDKLNVKRSIDELPMVFDEFQLHCKHKKNYRSKCFGESEKIKAEIKEQQLRNILREFLDTHVRGDVQTEFCTNFQNDEESVDIYIYDGVEKAIIEVKFSFVEKYYFGKTFYPFEKRLCDGMMQLDKYARHLGAEKRQVQYGYVYMFYCNDDGDEKIESFIANSFEKLKDSLSAEFHEIYKSTITNNLLSWGVTS